VVSEHRLIAVAGRTECEGKLRRAVAADAAADKAADSATHCTTNTAAHQATDAKADTGTTTDAADPHALRHRAQR
jgi:hypothetical protein